MPITPEDINTAGIIGQQCILKYMWVMEMADCWVSSERTKLSWKESRIYTLQPFSPCFYKNRTCPSITKRKNRKGIGAQINLLWICCSLPVLWPYASQQKATCAVLSLVGGGVGGKACLKLRANRRPKSNITISISEWNAPKYYTKAVKVLFIVIPEFKLKGAIQREQLDFSENA